MNYYILLEKFHRENPHIYDGPANDYHQKHSNEEFHITKIKPAIINYCPYCGEKITFENIK
ncbi:MAG: hypothetical protein KKF27_20455 [Gammaproteobacteria bacterium]|nr:hypothetical protein [Gammaproteobacteria bacterium]